MSVVKIFSRLVLEQIGYLLLKPERGSKQAGIQNYLSEWEKDDKEAGV